MLIAKMGLDAKDLPESDEKIKKMVLLVGGMFIFGFGKNTKKSLINNFIGDQTLDDYTDTEVSLAHDLLENMKQI